MAGLDRCGTSAPTGIRTPDRPARSQSLYRLRYPAHFVIRAVKFSSQSLCFSFRMTCRASSCRGDIARFFVGSHFCPATAHRRLSGIVRHCVVRVKSCKQFSAISMILLFLCLLLFLGPKDDHLTRWSLWRQMWAIRTGFRNIVYLKWSYSTFSFLMPLWFVAQKMWSVLSTLYGPCLAAGHE
jgi:hypothetical protein